MRVVTILDLETTGKFDPKHRIIEAALRRCNLDSGEEIDATVYRFDPERNIDAKAFAVHGIPLDDLKGKPKFADLMPELYKILKESTLVVAHNGVGFDFPFLAMEFDRNGGEMPPINEFDTMLQGNFATDLGKNPNLKELCFALGVDYDESLAHKGDYDTAVLRDAFFNGVRWGWFVLPT